MLTFEAEKQYLIRRIQSIFDVAKKKKTLSGVDPEYLKKQKEALVRRHRQII